MYGMTSSGKLFSDELTNWLMDDAGFNQSKFQMYVYQKYTSDGSKLVMLYYVDDCVYWYTYNEPGKWFVNTFGKRFHVKFPGYIHWFKSIRISQLRDHYISLDQAIYATSVVAKYLDTTRIKEDSKYHNTTLYHDMIFTK